MISKMFCVYDSKVEAYLPPFFMLSRGQALRAFIETASDKTTSIGKYPADFTLFEIGEFDDKSCLVECFTAPISLGTALALLPTSSILTSEES